MTMNSDKQKRIIQISENVLQYARNEMLLSMRFLDLALYKLKYEAADIDTVAVDGKTFFYNPFHIFKLYEQGNSLLNRSYLHSVLHCALLHPFISNEVDPELWDIACDLAVESIISEFHIKHLEDPEQVKIDYELNNIINKTGKLTAEKIYRYLVKNPQPKQYLDSLKLLMARDNHILWYAKNEDEYEKDQRSDAGDSSDESEQKLKADDSGDESKANSESDSFSEGSDNSSADLSNSIVKEPETGQDIKAFSQIINAEDTEQEWKDISEKIKVDIETSSKQWGDTSSNLSQNLIEVNREKYDYTDFLSKFTVLGEEMQVNDDEFDYIFYTYGLTRYGNMPLVEPLEYKEVKKIKEFIIAIDTSGSVMGDKVQSFITKTYNILTQRENFFNKINVHIIQCDAEIVDIATITNKEEFEEYIKNLTLKGFGGTDFRPVFKYAENKMAEGVFTNLKGLIYFTDGYGIFPEKKPDFDAAFVFVDDDYNVPQVPVWAIKLVLGTDDI